MRLNKALVFVCLLVGVSRHRILSLPTVEVGRAPKVPSS